MSLLSSRPVDYKVAVACWPITRAIGLELEKQLKLLFVFNKGKSAIFCTVDGDVYALGANPSGVLGTVLDKHVMLQLKSVALSKVWYKLVMFPCDRYLYCIWCR